MFRIVSEILTNSAYLISCQIAYLCLVMNYENPEYTLWSYVKPREKDGTFLYLRLRKTNNHTGSRFIKLYLVLQFLQLELPVAMSKRKVSDTTLQKLKFFSRVSCRFTIVFLRRRENKRKNHCLTDATLSYECEPSACKMKIFSYRPKPM